MFKKIAFILFAFCAMNSFAQQVSVKGKVVDNLNNPLPGVNIMIKGTNTGGTMTDANGSFSISIANNQTLVFSYIGFENKEIFYTGSSLPIIRMVSNIEVLEETVVIGYQTVKKADLTGAVSVLDIKTMKNTVVTGGVGDALINVPGVTLRTSGAPGSEGKVEIRGTGTFGNSNPLYVVDGVISGANRDFNFNDVESVQVLKDASAAAIYGSRAANGVVIITTKRGKGGKMKIEVSSKSTLQWLPQYDLAGRDKWIELNDLAFANSGRQPANHFDANTNWQKETFKTGLVQDNNLAFSGGDKTGSYYISANYQGNSGTTIGTKSERLTLRSNTSGERQFGDNLTFRIGENIILSNYKVDELSTNPIIDVFRMLPTIPIYDSNNTGGYGFGDGSRDVTFGTNPVAIEDLVVIKNSNLRIRGNVFAELEFKKTLKYRFNLGFDQSSDMYSNLRKAGDWTYNQPVDPSTLNKNQARSGTMIYDNTLEYNQSFGKHEVSAVGGISYQATSYEQIWGIKNTILSNGNDYFDQLDAGTLGPRTGSFKNIDKLFSMFARLNYNYSDKYLLSFTVRRDESSKFSPNYNTGIFPSISGAWRISNEKFFNVDWINDLKFRANYGILGSSNIGVWDWVSYINIYPQAVFGTGQNVVNGMTQVELANADLRWEKMHSMNTGFDLSMFNNKLQLSGDFYIKNTNDILTEMPILLSTGNNGGNPLVNAASVKNTGFDLSLSWKNKVGNLNYSLNVNGSYLENKIMELGYNRTMQDGARTRSIVGQPIGEWYLIKTDGLFKSTAEVQSHTDSNGNLIQPNAQPGDVKFIDFNDDGQITDSDRQRVGSSIPKVQLGMNATFEYKGIDLMLQFTSSLGSKIYNGPKSSYELFSDNSAYRANYDPWTPENPNASDPRPIYQDSRNVRGDQDRWLENGNFLRLSQLALGYNLPKSILGDDINARIFVNLHNILTLTSYSGLDPAFLNTSIWERSYDYGAYPNPVGVTLGAQISF